MRSWWPVAKSDLRQRFVAVCLSQLGKPYVYGANGPHEFDCSGLVVYALRSLGLIHPGEDYSAKHFFERCTPTASPLPGDLAFYGKKHISHVVVFLDSSRVISASGGDSKTTSAEIARKTGASIKVHRNALYRPDFISMATNKWLEPPNV